MEKTNFRVVFLSCDGKLRYILRSQSNEMKGFEKLVSFFEGKQYGDLILPFFELIAIIIGLLYVRKDKTGTFFLAYLIFDFFVFLCDTYIQTFSPFTKEMTYSFINITNTLISLAELLVYFYFFSMVLHNKAVINVMKICAAIFIVIIGIHVTTKYSFLTIRFSYITNLIGTIEFLFLVLPCFAYFYELVQNDSAISLNRRPSFWIVTGIFFYSVISIPYYMLSSYVGQNQADSWPATYLLFFCIPLSINFIFLTRAFLCKKTLTI